MGFDPYNSIQTFDWRQNAWSLILIFDSFFLNLYTKRDSRQYGRIFRHTFFFGKSLTGGAGFLLDSCKVCETNRQVPRAMLVSNPAAAKGGTWARSNPKRLAERSSDDALPLSAVGRRIPA